ncbi:hypothetical protein E2C01_041892 [Portunus trituberculatus]|uniref:Uncharacterized protein n=1 Tax=Portunus trituberculatus TaxID=210409 RepID=A0A5B7FRL1_PORTR|nr:hypothetical protein [Portunus trituberculatus]
MEEEEEKDRTVNSKGPILPRPAESCRVLHLSVTLGSVEHNLGCPDTIWRGLAWVSSSPSHHTTWQGRVAGGVCRGLPSLLTSPSSFSSSYDLAGVSEVWWGVWVGCLLY